MKCQICGKNYIALGVHVKLKHQMEAADYREEFGLMKTQPLVDDDLSEYMSRCARERIANDPEWREEVTTRMQRYIGITSRDNTMSKAGKEKLAQRNAENGRKYIDSISSEVAKILREKKTILDVTRELGCSRDTVMKIVNLGRATYDKKVARAVKDARTMKAVTKRKRGKKK